ncbi:MAG: response regulator [bacterium]|nr:response regulator [bacterium]
MDRYSVLFVDDEPNILRSLTRLFHRESFDVLVASGGEEALELLRSRPVQLVVTDNIMPRMTGVELIKKIRDSWPDTLRIILSGQSDMQAVLGAVNQGEAFRFLLKPWTDSDLKANVYIALAHYKLRQDVASLKNQLTEMELVLVYLQKQHPEVLATAPPEIQRIMTLESRKQAETPELMVE